MNLWSIILLAGILVAVLKLAGYLVPPSFIEKPDPSRVANLLTVAMLAALIAVQTLAVGSSLQLDARLPAVVIAGALFALRVPFIVVLIVAAGIAAGLRALGWAA